MFVVIEGCDCAGTSTQAKLLAEKVNAQLANLPDNSDIGQIIRACLQGKRTCTDLSLARVYAWNSMYSRLCA